MSLMRLAAVAALLLVALPPAQAEPRCGPFNASVPPPAPRTDAAAVSVFHRINAQVKTQPYRVLFLGDSLVERWNEPRWGVRVVGAADMVPCGVLDAGVSGDRTEHLRWRLDHGNLDGVLALPGCHPTLRLEAVRRRLQDRELLDLAARCDPAATDAIARSIIPRALGEASGEAAWPADEAAWEAARRRLLDLASCAVP